MRGFKPLLPLILTALAASAPAADQWYMSKSDHAHGEHAAHTQAQPRKWEPVREIDSRSQSLPQELYEVTQFPNGEQPTSEQRRRAEAFIKQCMESARRHGWFEFAKAVKDGYTLMYADMVHYVNMEYALDDRQLDPDRPEFLFFTDTPAGKRLVAFMFLALGPEDHGQQIGGPLTVWHFHSWSLPICLRNRRVAVADTDAKGRCADGVPTLRSPEMLHVWMVNRPEGPFATAMTITPEMLKEIDKPLTPSDRR